MCIHTHTHTCVYMCVCVSGGCVYGAFQVALVVKNPPANAGDIKKLGFHPWVGKISGRRKWQPTPIFLSEELHRKRRDSTHQGLTTHTVACSAT